MSVESIRPIQAVAPVEPVNLRAALEALGAKAGEAVAARVAAMLPEGIARLAIGTGTLDVRTSQPLVPGTDVMLTVERGGQAVKIALAEAGLATLRSMQGSPGAPARTTAAPASAGTASVPGAGTVATALVDLLARGLVSSGAAKLVEGGQVALAARGTSNPAQVEMGEDGASPPKALREALVQGVRAAAGRQESLTALFADLTAVAQGRTRAAIPAPVARAIAEVLGFRVPAEALATPAGLARALQDSGAQLEARLAALPPGMPLPPDLKAALQRLQSALAGWPVGLDDPAGGQAAAKTSGHERPPLRGALPHGQPVQQSQLGAASTPAEVAQILTERTEAALARITLLQAASLPNMREAARPDIQGLTTLEVPLRVGAETAVVQFQIQRDRDEADEPTARSRKAGDWTMRFSLDAEPLGPIHAAVRWHDGRVGIQLWAERDSVAAALEAQRAGLSDALSASAFTVERLTIASGTPPDPRTPTGLPRHRLDLSS